MLQAFGQRIRAQKQRWVLILDPPIHIKKGYYPYDSGIKNNVFMQDISGKPYVGQVMPWGAVSAWCECMLFPSTACAASLVLGRCHVSCDEPCARCQSTRPYRKASQGIVVCVMAQAFSEQGQSDVVFLHIGCTYSLTQQCLCSYGRAPLTGRTL